MSFSYLSVCSGLEGASLAFDALGATPVGFAEIEKFPSAIIAHRYGSNMPGEPFSHNAPPNFGDFTSIPLGMLGRVDVLIGGTPCQAFSIAGKRLSLEDARGNLTLSFAVLAHELARSHGLRNTIWENVPGCLSTDDNAFGCLMGALVGADDSLLPCEKPRRGKSNKFWKWRESGRWPVVDDDGAETGEYVERAEGHICCWPAAGMASGPRARLCWRILDAQYFGLAQRRERVFLVADFGNGADPAAVLFEPKSLRGNTPPSRKKGEGVAPTIAARTRGGGGLGTDFDCDGGLITETEVARCDATREGSSLDYETTTMIAEVIPLKEPGAKGDAGALKNSECGEQGDPMFTLGCGGVHGVAHSLRADGFDASEDGTGRGTPIVPVAFTCKDYGADAANDVASTLRAMGGNVPNGGGQIAVAFDLRGREGGAQFEGPHDTANIRAASGGSSRSYVAFAQNSRDEVRIQGDGDICGALSAEPGMKQQTYLAMPWAVRRLTPRECERLQGIPDDYTRIPWRGKPAEECPDGPRYKALGNSWAIPVVAWIGRRLADAMPKEPRP